MHNDSYYCFKLVANVGPRFTAFSNSSSSVFVVAICHLGVQFITNSCPSLLLVRPFTSFCQSAKLFGHCHNINL